MTNRKKTKTATTFTATWPSASKALLVRAAYPAGHRWQQARAPDASGARAIAPAARAGAGMARLAAATVAAGDRAGPARHVQDRATRRRYCRPPALAARWLPFAGPATGTRPRTRRAAAHGCLVCRVCGRHAAPGRPIDELAAGTRSQYASRHHPDDRQAGLSAASGGARRTGTNAAGARARLRAFASTLVRASA